MEQLSSGMKVALFATLLIATILFGLIISRGGRPYNTAFFTFHKLIAIGGLVFMILLLKGFFKVSGFDTLMLTLIIAGGLAFAGILVSGALLSLDKAVAAMVWLHKGSTLVYALSSVIVFLKVV